jgi:hypothetical protein
MGLCNREELEARGGESRQTYIRGADGICQWRYLHAVLSKKMRSVQSKMLDQYTVVDTALAREEEEEEALKWNLSREGWKISAATAPSRWDCRQD